jgi:hypothetical protein
MDPIRAATAGEGGISRYVAEVVVVEVNGQPNVLVNLRKDKAHVCQGF